MNSAVEEFLSKYKKMEENPKPVGSYRLRFGKHKNQTFDWIYNNDKQYVAWVVGNRDETYIKRLKKYFIERIEQEAEQDHAE